MDELARISYELLLQNRRRVGEYQYTLPSPISYPYQWFWDSCFHAIVLSHFNTDDAKRELMSLVAKQFDNGMIPHMIYWQRADAMNINWGKDGTSSITQPPMIAYAVWQIMQKDKDLDFLGKIYPHLVRFYKFILVDRDPHLVDLAGIINPDESGEDNSPRFDLPLGLAEPHTLDENFRRRLELIEHNVSCNFDIKYFLEKHFWMKEVPFNAILVENLGRMAKLASWLRKDEDVHYFEEKKNRVAKAMREYMLEDGLFWSVYGQDFSKIKVKTWAIFAPLFAKMLSKEEARKLIEKHLLNPNEFWTKYPVPTVSKDESVFNPNGFWRGPTWIAINWFIYKGLSFYGYDSVAGELRERSRELLGISGFREQFDPDTGVGYGARQFTWGTLIVDMVGPS